MSPLRAKAIIPNMYTLSIYCNTWLLRNFGEGNGYPLKYSCMENSTDRGAWQATVHGVTKSLT